LPATGRPVVTIFERGGNVDYLQLARVDPALFKSSFETVEMSLIKGA
jgi:hypothetical protein